MVEFSIAELVLFCWSVIATAYALKYKEDAKGANMFARLIIERKEVRDQLVAEYEKFQASQ